MRERTFDERANAYLDNELTASETAAFEAEMRDDPALEMIGRDDHEAPGCEVGGVERRHLAEGAEAGFRGQPPDD